MDRRQKEGHIYNAICYLRIRIGGDQSGKQTKGPTLVTATSDCDITSDGGPIASEKGQLDQKRLNEIGRG